MIRLLPGDCRTVLATLPADSVHCCVTSPPYYGLRAYLPDGHADKHREIGLEATPEAYLAEMVRVFREVKRVLRPDGTCWVNMGDSYSGNPTSGGTNRNDGGPAVRLNGMQTKPGKPKDLLMMPARLALALQADGWWLRSDIIWHKPNPMPESVTDRPTSAHEHVFLLAKAARYFYDADAVREPHNDVNRPDGFLGRDGVGLTTYDNQGWAGTKTSLTKHREYNPAGRNLRNVWTIATAPFSEAHFATFPPALAERCIRAGTSERGCCAACGAPWGRQTDTSYQKLTGSSGRSEASGSNGWDGGGYPRMDKRVTTTGWAPSCACDAGTVPCTVLDPFAGAGTTLLVADRLQRDAIGVELNPDYTRMAMDRCRDDAPLFAEPSPPPAEPPEDERIRDLFAEPLAAD